MAFDTVQGGLPVFYYLPSFGYSRGSFEEKRVTACGASTVAPHRDGILLSFLDFGSICVLI